MLSCATNPNRLLRKSHVLRPRAIDFVPAEPRHATGLQRGPSAKCRSTKRRSVPNRSAARGDHLASDDPVTCPAAMDRHGNRPAAARRVPQLVLAQGPPLGRQALRRQRLATGPRLPQHAPPRRHLVTRRARLRVARCRPLPRRQPHHRPRPLRSVGADALAGAVKRLQDL